MKKTGTIEERIESMQKEIRRLETLNKVVERLERDLKYDCMIPRVVKHSWSETYTDENGEEKRKWHSAVYEEDENGETIYDEPNEDDYCYENYVAMRELIDEIRALA